MSVALVTHTKRATYHLRRASFGIAGPTPATLRTDDADLQETALTAELSPGRYTATLADGWALFRADSGGDVPVQALLVSPNPASFDVTAGATAFVPFRFSPDGSIITLGTTGSVAIDAEVSEQTGLRLLAGSATEAGAADGVGAAARFLVAAGLATDDSTPGIPSTSRRTPSTATPRPRTWPSSATEACG